MIFYQTMPPLSAEEYDDLKQNIAKNGIAVPVIVDEEGNVIDGHHRVNIARELGIEYPTRVLSGLSEEEKLDRSVMLNIARRQLNREQKRQIIAEQLKRHPEKSNREHAREVGVSDNTVRSVRGELESTAQIAQLEKTLGADGKERPANRPSFDPDPSDPETPAVVSPVSAPSAATPEAAPEPTPVRKVTGLDGKQYSAPKPQQESKPRQHPLPDQFFRARYDMSRKVESLERLADDQRFTTNKEKVAQENLNDLNHAIEALQRIVASLQN